MFLKAHSELMLNHKHAEIMPPDRQFEVLQTSTGGTLFFSIGADDALYVTREINNSKTGWTGKTDLSSALKVFHGNQPVKAKSFSLSQNPATLNFDIALAVSVAGEDFLYMSLNHANTEDAWKAGITWKPLPFDAVTKDRSQHIVIADIYLMNVISFDSPDTVIENCFVDVIQDPGSNLKLLDRYYVKPNGTPRWTKQSLAINLEEGSISSCLGSIKSELAPGIYTYGSINEEQQLAFRPQYNAFDPTVAPSATLFNLPAGSSTIVSSPDKTGFTNLFVAATSGLWLYSPDDQTNGSSPIQAVAAITQVSKDLFTGVSHMTASSTGSTIVVWCLNTQGQLFYLSCAQGSELNAGAWSHPVPICSDVKRFSFYVNHTSSSNDLFVHLSDQQMVRFSQEPLTGMWSRRPILLPSLNVSNLYELQTFTTTISVCEEDRSPALNKNITLVSLLTTTVYINDTYHQLNPKSPITISTGTTGRITVVQEVNSLSAVSYNVTLPGSKSSVFIDPTSNAIAKLSTINSGNDLSAVNVPTPDGKTKPLLSSDVSSQDRDAVADMVKNLIEVRKQLPADGTTAGSAGTPSLSSVDNIEPQAHSQSIPHTFGIVFDNAGFRYHEATHHTEPAAINTAPMNVELAGLGDVADYLFTKSGDFFEWVDDVWDKVKSAVVKFAKGVWVFVVEIAGEAYTAILNCVAAVASAIKWVFNKIKVVFDDLIAWLGFLFQWDDIVRTHKVFKNILKQNCSRVVQVIDQLEGKVTSTFKSIENQISTWGDLKDNGKTTGSQAYAGNDDSGINSPQSTWGAYHTQHGVDGASVEHSENTDLTKDALDALKTLEGMVQKEEQTIKTAVTQIKDEVAAKFNSLTAVEIIKKILAIIGNLITKTAETIIVGLLQIIKILVKSAFDLLDAPLNIPVISTVYKTISGGSELSVLDLMCLVGAIPATIVCKIATKKAPFPDNSHTQALIQAQSFDAIKSLLTGNTHRVREANVIASVSEKATVGTDTVVKAQATSSVDTMTQVVAGLSIAALFGEQVCCMMTGLKLVISTEKVVPPVVKAISVVAYLVYVGPNVSSTFSDQGKWYNIMNDTVTMISIAKCLLDNSMLSNNDTWNDYISPFVESVINLCWLVPAIAVFVLSDKNKPSDYLGFIANLAFDVGGIITPLTSKKITTPKIAAICFLIQTACNATSGYSLVGTGVSQLLGK